MGNSRAGAFGFGSEFDDSSWGQGRGRDGKYGVGDIIAMLFGDFIGESGREESGKFDFAEELKKAQSKAMLKELGVTTEVGDLLNPDLEVDYIDAFEKEVLEKAHLQLEHDVVTQRLDKLLPAIANQSKLIVKQFKELEDQHEECHRDWRREEVELQRLIQVERRETTLFRSTVKDLDLRLKGFIADFGSADEIPKEEVLEFMESLRDTVQDTYDEYRYVSDRDTNPDAVRPKSRREKREEAMASQAEASDDSAQASDEQTGGDKIPEGTFGANSAEASSEESQDQADAATV